MGFAIPQKLSDAFAEKRVILFVGAGMSMPQLPGWEKLLRDMLASAIDGRAAAILKGEKRIRARMDNHQFLEAASLLRAGMSARDFCGFLNQRLRAAKGDIRHQIAARLPLAAILSTNFDTSIEDAFGADRPDVLNQQKLPELMRAGFVLNGPGGVEVLFFLDHLGDFSRPGGVFFEGLGLEFGQESGPGGEVGGGHAGADEEDELFVAEFFRDFG